MIDGVVVAKAKTHYPTQEAAEAGIFESFKDAIGTQYAALKLNYDHSLNRLTVEAPLN